MGGRGGSFGTVPKLKNPAGIPSNAITEDEFLMLKGVGDITSGYTVDKVRGNRALKTQRGQDRFEKEVLKANEDYAKRRKSARTEYKSLVSRGLIRDKSPVERRLTAAHGHADNKSTQAARRLLAKQGIDWKTGKKTKS